VSAVSVPAETSRFPCTLGGSIAASRRRFKVLMLGMGLLMLVVAVVVFLDGRVVAALLALAVAIVSRLAWRMSGDLTPVRLEVGPGGVEGGGETGWTRSDDENLGVLVGHGENSRVNMDRSVARDSIIHELEW